MQQLWIGLPLTAASLLAIFALVVWAQQNCSVLDGIHSQMRCSRMVLGLFVIAMWVYAGSKPERRDACNATLNAAATLALPISSVDDETDSKISSLCHPVLTRSLYEEDFACGAVMTRVGANEMFDLSPPTNAVVCADWRAFGAATDWIYLTFTNWSVRIDGHDVNRLRIFSFGKVQPLIRQPSGKVATNRWYAPLQTSLGVVPSANWHLLKDGKRPSQF